jgi:nitrite reductase/ring-hydroxylating ferredoxin subunit
MSDAGEIDLTRVLCRIDELAATGCREFRLGGGEWPLHGFVVRVGAQALAYVNRCPHRAFPLNHLPDRFLSHDGTVLQCCFHGAMFEKSTGQCIAGPCVGRALTSVPVRICAGLVLLGDDVDPAELAARHA